MSINLTKREVTGFTWKSKPVKASYIIHGQNLIMEISGSGKYLGVTLSNNLLWNVDDKTNKANRTINFL